MPTMTDWNFPELARIVERMQALAAVELALESRPLAEGWMAFGGPGAYVNKAAGFGVDRPMTEAELDGLVAFFTSRRIEPKVELSPFVGEALLAALARRGFVLQRFVNVLVLKLAEGDAPLAPLSSSGPEGVRIERVDPSNEAALREYVAAAASGFLPEGEPVPPIILELGLKGARRPAQDAFIARVGREVVGAGGCESREGATALFGTSVKPAWRRRGIQRALMAARLERARERGSHLAIILSTPGIPTERNATRLGFMMAYSRVILVKHGEGLSP